MKVSTLGFIETLLCIIGGNCPVCRGNQLYGASPGKTVNSVSCACGWTVGLEDLRLLATGGKTVLRMRDEFLQLVGAYNTIGSYKDAQDAQAMAIALNNFEERHDITEILWPPQIAGEEDHDKWLKRLEDVTQ